MGCFGSQEYDAAQDRGEVKRNGGDRSTVEDRNTASAADLGLKRPDIHDFRQIAAAEDAEIRLAQEYDAAQEAGDVAGHGGGRNFKVADGNLETNAADLGLKRPDIHDFRQIAAAEDAEIRLAQEYDAAQEDGDGAFHGNQWSVADDNAPPTAADLGLKRPDIQGGFKAGGEGDAGSHWGRSVHLYTPLVQPYTS